MNNTAKIRGFVAAKKNVILFLYRKTHKQTYLVKFEYKSRTHKISLGSSFYGLIYPNIVNV